MNEVTSNLTDDQADTLMNLMDIQPEITPNGVVDQAENSRTQINDQPETSRNSVQTCSNQSKSEFEIIQNLNLELTDRPTSQTVEGEKETSQNAHRETVDLLESLAEIFTIPITNQKETSQNVEGESANMCEVQAENVTNAIDQKETSQQEEEMKLNSIEIQAGSLEIPIKDKKETKQISNVNQTDTMSFHNVAKMSLKQIEAQPIQNGMADRTPSNLNSREDQGETSIRNPIESLDIDSDVLPYHPKIN